MISGVRGRLVVPVVMWAVRFKPGPGPRPGPDLRRLDSTHGQRRQSSFAPGSARSSPASSRRPGAPWWTGAPRLFSGASSADQLTLEGVAKDIRDRKLKRVVVMAGAGISTPSGIPDFRSPGSGLYDNLQQYSLPYAEAIFDIGFFRRDPRPFFALARALYPGTYRPNAAHFFIRLLHQKNQLLRMYTQNIDGLERLAGVPPEKLVEAHGTFSTATCTVCRRKYDGADLRPDVMKGEVPKCRICTGVVKPDIVFFGEELPVHFFKYLTDFPLADLLIIMGTSLEVEPFASLAGAVRRSVPRMLINRHRVGPFTGERRLQDVVQLGDVVHGVQTLVDAVGWTKDLRTLMDMHMVRRTED